MLGPTGRGATAVFAECLDPDIVLLTPTRDYHGRMSVMKYLKDYYFRQSPPVLVSFTMRAPRVIGKVIWIESEMSVTLCGQVTKVRGTALYQKAKERWLMSQMNFAVAAPAK